MNPRERLRVIANMMRRNEGTPAEFADLFRAYDILTCDIYAEESLKRQFNRRPEHDSPYLKHLLEDEL